MANLENKDSVKVESDVTKDVAKNFSSENFDKAMMGEMRKSELSSEAKKLTDGDKGEFLLTEEEIHTKLNHMEISNDFNLEKIDYLIKQLNSGTSLSETIFGSKGAEFIKNDFRLNDGFAVFGDIVNDLRIQYEKDNITKQQRADAYKIAICIDAMTTLMVEEQEIADKYEITKEEDLDTLSSEDKQNVKDIEYSLTSLYNVIVDIANKTFGKNINKIIRGN